jgi:hypothetical protein
MPIHTPPLSVPCPTCGADTDHACHTLDSDRVTRPHMARVHAATRAGRRASLAAARTGTWHLLGPITRQVIAQRRTGDLDPAAESPRVYGLLLRTAVAADRAARDGWRPGGP